MVTEIGMYAFKLPLFCEINGVAVIKMGEYSEKTAHVNEC